MSNMIERRPFARLGEAEHGGLKASHHFSFAAKGRVEVNGVAFDARDGAAVDTESSIKVVALEDAELVLVDVTR
jgi:hypothetical protein